MKAKILVIPEDILKKPFITIVETYAIGVGEYVSMLNKKGGINGQKGRYYELEKIESYEIKSKN